MVKHVVAPERTFGTKFMQPVCGVQMYEYDEEDFSWYDDAVAAYEDSESEWKCEDPIDEETGLPRLPGENHFRIPFWTGLVEMEAFKRHNERHTKEMPVLPATEYLVAAGSHCVWRGMRLVCTIGCVVFR